MLVARFLAGYLRFPGVLLLHAHEDHQVLPEVVGAQHVQAEPILLHHVPELSLHHGLQLSDFVIEGFQRGMGVLRGQVVKRQLDIQS